MSLATEIINNVINPIETPSEMKNGANPAVYVPHKTEVLL
jgi:hypothetical protein